MIYYDYNAYNIYISPIASYYAPQRVQVVVGLHGPLLVVTPARMVYFGVAFVNFWRVLLVRGVPEETVELLQTQERLGNRRHLLDFLVPNNCGRAQWRGKAAGEQTDWAC